MDLKDCNDARLLDGLAWDLLLADAPRGSNRAMIADEANGAPPYTPQEAEENEVQINVNDLSMTRSLHDARGQFTNAFLKQGNYFRCRTDMGNKHKRSEYSTVVTTELNKYLKRSIRYFEAWRSKIALLVLHGITPSVWETEDKWCPKVLGIGDVLMPSETLLGFDNLPWFFLRRSFTGIELQRLTRKETRDPGWNMDMVESCLRWIDDQTTVIRGNNWPDVWSPEKVAERRKQDGGFYANDRAPAVDTFDIYVYVDDGKEAGWVRRVILDSWGTPNPTGQGAYSLNRATNKKDLEPKRTEDFLFTSKDRRVADSWENIISFQFADLSAVAPFRYHSVRSLGYLLYSVCHLQSRLRCKFNESVFETLMMLFRVKSMDDVQRALKLDLVNKGFIDDTISPVPAAERWQPNEGLVQLGLRENQQLISDSTGAFSQDRNFSKDRTEKTRYQVMAEMNASTAMISAGLQQAYQYQAFEDREILRRFMKKHSTDPDVKQFQASVLKKGVPEKLLVAEAWDVEHERVMGAGNKTLEMQQTEALMSWRPLFDPQSQRTILRDSVLAVTDNADLANELVPDMPVISDSVHDSELAFGALMQGGKVTPKPGLNAVEAAGTVLGQMEQKVQQIMQTGGVGTLQDLVGLSACAQYVAGFIQQLAMDKSAKPVVKQLGDRLGKVMNEVKAMAQRQQEMMQKQAQQNGGMDPKDMAKLQAMQMQSQAKMQNTRESHAQRTAQRQIQFEQKLHQDAQKHQVELQKKRQEVGVDLAAKELQTAAEIRNNRLKSLSAGDES